MELNIRKLKETDWETLCEWWKEWPMWEPPALEFLPDNGKGGLMVERNGKPVMAGFIYLTNSKTALLEWIISDPQYRETDRKELLELLITGSEDVCKELGYMFLFSVCRSKKLINTHKKLGWNVDENPSYELVKILN